MLKWYWDGGQDGKLGCSKMLPHYSRLNGSILLLRYLEEPIRSIYSSYVTVKEEVHVTRVFLGLLVTKLAYVNGTCDGV